MGGVFLPGLAGGGGTKENYITHEQLLDNKLILGSSPHRNYMNKNLEKYGVKTAVLPALSGAFPLGLVFFHIKC